MANAICHRDYVIDAPVSIRFYDDRLEIWNPGRLPSDLPAEELLKTHDSRAPNQLIANAFYNTKIIERFGTGTIRMAEALEAQKQPPPFFDISSSNYFKVTMFASGYSTSELHSLDLNDRQIKAIRYLQLHKTIANTEYQVLFESSKATATRDLSQLVKLNIITKVGTTGKGTSYVLIEHKGLK
jgi:ATP-dependent DNA helicase RecG